MTLEEQIAIWIKQAEHDMEGARSAREAGFHDHCAVLCEQASEKFLKAPWMWRNRSNSPRTHRLDDLAQKLGAAQDVLRAARLLTPDYITARYPDAATVAPFERYDGDVADRRLAAAETIAGWVRAAIDEERDE